ncbi:Alpha/Beta hydrolase protein [Lasiosphaeria ovina]|uniref:Alpha/Beta hydrolase protein n=1 Tax=Lasiosphaeria ovina TaxID=92902 RepID=A0AAE0KDL8_9PEZI|nr:Alpha/Beta hydrolase protein [Lasiosphaeria ovina]KAK3374011.1 Alpha/Beta hydrolase protein [Lasiosphaeria ovina]
MTTFTEQEGTFDVGGKSLYTKTFLPAGPIKAKLVFVHGFSDHVGRYTAFFSALAERGIAVYGFDQRGWGRSVSKPSEKGLTGPTTRVIADIAAFVQPHLPASPSSDPPLFVMGHSMGGGEVLTLAADATYQDSVVRHVRGWLLESPFISFSPEEQPSWLKINAGRLAGRLLPRHQLYHELAPANLSRDAAVVQSIGEDTLMHNTGTLEGLAGLLDRTQSLVGGATRPRGDAVRSVWFGHGTSDKATNFASSKNYFDKFLDAVPDKQFKAYDGWYHQLHADGPCSAEFYRDVGDWILAHVDAPTPTPTPTTDAKPPAPAAAPSTDAKL